MPEKVQIADRQKYPFLMIPKAIFRLDLSDAALRAYLAIKNFANTATGTTQFTAVPIMAALVGVSVSTFQRGVRELVKKRALRVRYRSRKSPRGTRSSLPNLYEILHLDQGPI